MNNQNKIENMRIGGKILSDFFEAIKPLVKEGISTKELDDFARNFIIARGARPSFLHYNGFPGSICTSINDVIIHGIPSKKTLLKNGDIIGIDVGACYNGYHVDACRTYLVGNVAPDVAQLVQVTKECFYEGIKNLKAGSRVGDISARVQQYAEKHGYGVVREFVGHGCGAHLHEDPNIPNYGTAGLGPKLIEGQTIAIEPMINLGTKNIITHGMWDVKTADGKPSSHYENTILITADGVEILTDCGGN